MGAVQTLIVFENEPTMRYTVKNASTAEEKVRSIALTLILALTLTLTLTPTLTLTLALTLPGAAREGLGQVGAGRC